MLNMSCPLLQGYTRHSTQMHSCRIVEEAEVDDDAEVTAEEVNDEVGYA